MSTHLDKAYRMVRYSDGGTALVQDARERIAQLIAQLDALRANQSTEHDRERGRYASLAITDLERACMYAERALTG